MWTENIYSFLRQLIIKGFEKQHRNIYVLKLSKSKSFSEVKYSQSVTIERKETTKVCT